MSEHSCFCFLQKEDGQSVFGGEEESRGPPTTPQGGENKGPLPGNGSGGGDKKIPGNGGRAGKISSSNNLTGKLRLLFFYASNTTCIMNANLSQQRIWQCQQEQANKGHFDSNVTTATYLCVSLKSGSLYF